MEQNDYKMQEITQQIINFYKSFATKLDADKEKLKKTELDFQISLANCGDHHDEITSS
jgi:hypothetical protein